MRRAGDITAAQAMLALTVLSLLMSSGSASYRTSRDPKKCTPDITDANAYKTEHPICSRLAAKNQATTDFRVRCAMRRGPMNVTLHWSNDPSRAASALLVALLRHVYKFQRVHLAPEATHFSQMHKPDELVISLAALVQDEAAGANTKGLTAFVPSHVPTRRRLHAWLTPAARLIGACQHTNWAFYTNLTARALCGFVVPSPYSFPVSIDAVEILGVGDNCEATMKKLQQRAEAAGTPTRATIFLNRTVFKHYLLTSKHSFLFLDFDIWSGEPNVGVVEPPPCVSDRADGVCESELDDSTGKLVIDSKILKYNRQLFSLVRHFKPAPESLRVLLDQETNGVNLEEAACEQAEKISSYVQKLRKSINQVTVAIFLCAADPDVHSYDMIIRSAGLRIFKESREEQKKSSNIEKNIKRLLDISFGRYFINCSDTYNMSRRLDDLMEHSDPLNMLGVVSLTVEGAAAASAVAAAHRVPLLLAHVVPDGHVTGNTTWQAAGRVRNIGLALQHFVDESRWSRVVVLSQPTTFARQYFAAFQDKAKFLLRNFEIPLDLTEELVREALRDLQDENTRVVVVNTNSDAATLILAVAVKLSMSYEDGFIWIVREPRSKPECSTTHFTVSLNKVVDKPWKQSIRGVVEVGQLLPPHSVPLADALMTVSRGFNHVFQQHSDMLTDLHSDQLIRAFDDSLKERPVTGFNGGQLHYKDRALEEAIVYVNELCYGSKHRRLATWRVNATSGSVSNEDGGYATFRLDLSVESDAGGDASDRDADTDADGGTQHSIVTNKPANFTQWIESIAKIESPISVCIR